MATVTETTVPAGEHADHGDHGHHGPKWLQHHFDTPIQQFESSKLGMWLFLAQEILFFSGLFVAYGIVRVGYPEAFAAGSHELNRFIGGGNTIVLLFSSFTAAAAVRSAQLGEKQNVSRYLIITMLCACAFLVIKYFEYSLKFEHGLLPGVHWHPHLDHELPAHTHVFFGIYFLLTGLHGLHVAIGIGVIFWVWRRNERGDFSKEYWTPVDLVALYWHLVDLVWIYLFPLLYLI